MFLTEAPSNGLHGGLSERTLSNSKSNGQLKKMLKSIATEVVKSGSESSQRELVFSNVEVVENAKKKQKSKYTHCRALFNLNKSLLQKSHEENTQPNFNEESTKPNTARNNLGSSSSRGRIPSSSTYRRTRNI